MLTIFLLIRFHLIQSYITKSNGVLNLDLHTFRIFHISSFHLVKLLLSCHRFIGQIHKRLFYYKMHAQNHNSGLRSVPEAKTINKIRGFDDFFFFFGLTQFGLFSREKKSQHLCGIENIVKNTNSLWAIVQRVCDASVEHQS